MWEQSKNFGEVNRKSREYGYTKEMAKFLYV
jgi:hypothetical protein